MTNLDGIAFDLRSSDQILVVAARCEAEASRYRETGRDFLAMPRQAHAEELMRRALGLASDPEGDRGSPEWHLSMALQYEADARGYATAGEVECARECARDADEHFRLALAAEKAS